MMVIQIEGTLDQLRQLTKLPGLSLSRGATDLGGGKWRAGATIQSRATLAEVESRGMKVTITLDEAETAKRLQGGDGGGGGD